MVREILVLIIVKSGLMNLFKLKLIQSILLFNYVSSYAGKMGIQNGFNGTRLFLFNGNDTIPGQEFQQVDAFRQTYLTTNFYAVLSTYILF